MHVSGNIHRPWIIIIIDGGDDDDDDDDDDDVKSSLVFHTNRLFAKPRLEL